MLRTVRMKRELAIFTESPPHGVTCWPIDDAMDRLYAQIIGPEDTPYFNGIFKLEIIIPERYPMEPPKMQFLTPIYHPNIDSAGRICLDSLKMPPKGAWKPSLNISTLLTSVLLLMTEPNPDDPLMTDIANEFTYSRDVFQQKAKDWTRKYAMNSANTAAASSNLKRNNDATSAAGDNVTSDARPGSSSDTDSDSESDAGDARLHDVHGVRVVTQQSSPPAGKRHHVSSESSSSSSPTLQPSDHKKLKC